MTTAHTIESAAQIADAAIDALLAEKKIAYSVRYVGQTTRDRDGKTGKGWDCDQWCVTFGTGANQVREDYFTGLGLRKKYNLVPSGRPVAPTAASVLYSLLLDSSACDESFADWCANYGYSADSISALHTYQQCDKIGRSLRKVFDHETRARMSEILQDY